MTVDDTRGILPSVSNCRQLWQVAKRCSWQRPVARSSLLVQPSRHVQLLLQSLNLENCFLLSAVLSSDLAFSLPLSLSLRTFLQQQGLLTTLAYPCAFSQSVFTHGLSSSHQISHFWSSLGHDGHCCVFLGCFGLFGTRRVSRWAFSAFTVTVCSHARAARAAAVSPRLRSVGRRAGSYVVVPCTVPGIVR